MTPPATTAAASARRFGEPVADSALALITTASEGTTGRNPSIVTMTKTIRYNHGEQITDIRFFGTATLFIDPRAPPAAIPARRHDEGSLRRRPIGQARGRVRVKVLPTPRCDDTVIVPCMRWASSRA